MEENGWEQYLEDIYYNPKHSASFTGPDKLYQFILNDAKYNLTLREIRGWLSAQEPYTLHRSIRRRFERNRVMVSGIDDQVIL